MTFSGRTPCASPVRIFWCGFITAGATTALTPPARMATRAAAAGGQAGGEAGEDFVVILIVGGIIGERWYWRWVLIG